MTEVFAKIKADNHVGIINEWSHRRWGLKCQLLLTEILWGLDD
jgi:hypothetical protein